MHRGRKLASDPLLDAPGGTGSICSQPKDEAVGDRGRRREPEAVVMRPGDCSPSQQWRSSHYPLASSPGRLSSRGLRKSTCRAPRFVRSRRWRYIPSTNEVSKLPISLPDPKDIGGSPAFGAHHGTTLRRSSWTCSAESQKTAGRGIRPSVHRGTGAHGRRCGELGPAPVAHSAPRDDG